MELNREHFCAIIFYNFRRGLTQRHHIDEVNSIFEDEAPSRTSVYVVVHSKKNFVKVVQNQLLFRKPLMLCANWYCKIVMWPIVATLGICGTSIHSILHKFVNRLKKCLFRLVERNAPKIQSPCFETFLWHLARWWLVDLREWDRK